MTGCVDENVRLDVSSSLIADINQKSVDLHHEYSRARCDHGGGMTGHRITPQSSELVKYKSRDSKRTTH